MSGKVYNLSEKAMTEKYEDYVFTKVMALYAEEESAKILRRLEEEPFEANPKAIEKIYSKIERRENLSNVWKYSRKLLQFAAMVVFVAVVSVSSVVVASADAREAVAEAIYHLVLRETDRYTEVSIGNSSGFIDPEIYDWEGAYAPTYMPEGFILIDKIKIPNKKIMTYGTESASEYVIITQAGENATLYTDTENADIVRNITINESDALYIEKNGSITIAFSCEDTFIFLSGELESSEIIKIAEGLRPIGKTETEEPPEEEYTFVDPEIYVWEEGFGLTYVPEDFNLYNSKDLELSRIINYKKGEDYIGFVQYLEGSGSVNTDTEDADLVETIRIGESEAFHVIKDNWSCVFWSVGDVLLQISGTAPADEIVKVAENVRYYGTAKEPPEEKYTFIDPEIYDWEGAYAPTYIPEGYIFDEKQELTTRAIITYSNGNSYFTITQSNKTASLHMDTEDADSVSEVIINNSQGILVEKDGFSSLAWNVDENFFWVRGEIESAELIEIAEGLKPLN